VCLVRRKVILEMFEWLVPPTLRLVTKDCNMPVPMQVRCNTSCPVRLTAFSSCITPPVEMQRHMCMQSLDAQT
jgi:hypothetical protein